jgi:hypothetical protein
VLGLWRFPPEYEFLRDRAAYSKWHWITGGVIRDARASNRIIKRVLKAADAPYPQALERVRALGEDPEFAAELEGLAAPYSATTTSWYSCLRSEAAILTSLRAAKAAAGCRLFEIRRGRSPANLQEMTKALPQHFSRVPDDPISGKSLLYRKTKTGFVAYGVGPYDPGDDGGKLSFIQSWDPDIVFPVDPPAYRVFLKQQALDYKKRQLRGKRRRRPQKH